MFEIATWNISGGQSSAQAPSSWTAVDHKTAVVKEIKCWNADKFALQECESREPYQHLITQYTCLGAAEAHCGYVQPHVRLREGFHAEGICEESLSGHSVVQVSLTFETGVADVQRHWRMLAVHFPRRDPGGALDQMLQGP